MTPPAPLKRLRRWVRTAVLRAAVALVALLPLRLARRLGRGLGALAFHLAKGERSKALASLAQAFPDKTLCAREALARACFRHLGECALELCCIAQLDRAMEQEVVWSAESRAVLDRALAAKRGVLFVSGHVGNWELLARRVALAGYPCQTIAKEASDPGLTRLIERFRSSGRLQSLWRGHDGAAKAMLRALRGGEILGMLIDQDTKVQSVFVPFFGQTAATPRAAADLAIRTGAQVVMGFCQRQAGRYQLTFKALPAGADPVALTAAMTTEIEAAIRRAPEQWVWMHRRWKTRP